MAKCSTHKDGGVYWFAKATIVKYHRLGSLNNINLFLTVLEDQGFGRLSVS